jgi:anti-anti-sigma factor
VSYKGDQLASKSYSQPPSGRELRNGYSLLPAPQNGGGITLAISGEIDLSNADAFTNEVQSLFNGADGEMTLDLRNCVFIDSAGIRALVVLAQEQRARGRTLKLSGVTGEPERVLRLSGLLDSGLLDERTHQQPVAPHLFG